MVRPVLAILSAAGLSAMSCATSPPCYAIRQGLVVAIAESVDAYEAPKQSRNWERVPIRMRLRKRIYGPSPGAEFTLHWFASASLRAGELIYIEESATPLRATSCGHTDSVSAINAKRQQFFQERARGQHHETYVRVGFQQAPNSAIRLSGPNGTLETQTDARGLAEWRNLPPGRYTVHPARSGFTLDLRREPTPEIQLLPGACALVLFDAK